MEPGDLREKRRLIVATAAVSITGMVLRRILPEFRKNPTAVNIYIPIC